MEARSSLFDGAHQKWQATLDKFWRPGPRHLYHYTSGPGLHGILSSHSMRGGNFAFMNDRSEFQYAKSVLWAVLDYFLVGTPDAVMRNFVTRLRDPRHVDSVDLYITCFCEQEDLLSQWRGYGNDESRYCIRFDTARLRRTAAEVSPPLRVVYDATEQKDAVEALVRAHIDALRTIEASGEVLDDAVRSVYSVLLPLIATFKDRAFASELEWRHVLIVDSDGTAAPLTFANSNGVMKPYRTLVSGSRTDDRLPITQLIAGAARLEAQTLRSARMMLDHYGYSSVTVEASRVPLQP